MSILKLIASSNFITFNKFIAKKIGVDEALVFGELCSYQQMKQEAEFSCGQDVIMDDTSLSDYRVRNAIKNLKNIGLISVTKKGLPCKYYYTISEEKVAEILINPSNNQCITSAPKIASTGDPKSASTGDTKNASTYNNIYNNIYNKKEKDNSKELSKKKVEKVVSKKVFKKPTVEEVRNYCIEANINIDADRFIDFYESKGWKVGSAPMKDWKAAVRNWSRRENNTTTTTATSSQSTTKPMSSPSINKTIAPGSLSSFTLEDLESKANKRYKIQAQEMMDRYERDLGVKT